ncbi:hypothetical protein [Bacillus sp. ISL-55]|uniref:hypothetical protein n=1 Tax=Bacillus sp. ISL-55 TaxID=2819134 RepID=UPI001BE50C12|nr:hypothetical protein [Bacillus sp. ISL-55]MBT2694397.1 hypothetical protein [Bacillus sp. ISL-55]
MPTHFLRAWAGSRKPNQCPAGAAGQVRPRRSKATRRLSASPEEELIMKKTVVGLFHILPAESEAPGTKINSLVQQSLTSFYYIDFTP